jgi:hypothetical protein
MKNRQARRIPAFILAAAVLLSAAGIAGAMEIETDGYRPPSAAIEEPGEGMAEPAKASDSGTQAEQATPEPADYSSLWIGERTLQEQPESTLTITAGEDGKLHMEAFFYRMYFLEADLEATDERLIIFNDHEGLKGSLVREDDGSIILAAGRSSG